MNNHRKSFTFLILGVFITIFSFTFLTKNFATHEHPVQATTLDNFRPGNIISDYVMSNYNSMSEAEIQSFLKSKNHCNDTNISKATKYPNLHYHIKDGHFVCLADELFGNGTNYGGTTGETAAHIIWQAAQDYHINPQVLLVLLQKEQGLITDTWPNHIQYRSATGYGCPDTAACNSEYYGFKNQISKAAQLFRTVLNGGWTNYPLGNNFIQYNPNKACGGSIVNIENLATSSLYRYTPYQPNAGTLAAGTGTAYCGAYGNRNFYLYFSNWFGDPTKLGWVDLENPRHLITINQANIINGISGKIISTTTAGINDFYTSKIIGPDGNWCLRSEINEKNNSNFCISFSDLKDTEWHWQDMETPRYLTSKSQTLINPGTKKIYSKIIVPKVSYYNKKTILADGRLCLKSLDKNLEQGCVLFEDTEKVNWKVLTMQYPRILASKTDNFEFINPTTRTIIDNTEALNPHSVARLYFSKKIILPDGKQCLGDINVAQKCSLFDGLKESWMDMEFIRDLTTNKDVNKVNAFSNTNEDNFLVKKGTTRTFVSKILTINNRWCLQTEYDKSLSTDNCIHDYDLDEAWNIIKPTDFTIKEEGYKIDAKTLKPSYDILLSNGMVRKYLSKILLPNNIWCLRTEYDHNLRTNNCVEELKLEINR